MLIWLVFLMCNLKKAVHNALFAFSVCKSSAVNSATPLVTMLCLSFPLLQSLWCSMPFVTTSCKTTWRWEYGSVNIFSDKCLFSSAHKLAQWQCARVCLSLITLLCLTILMITPPVDKPAKHRRAASATLLVCSILMSALLIYDS